MPWDYPLTHWVAPRAAQRSHPETSSPRPTLWLAHPAPHGILETHGNVSISSKSEGKSEYNPAWIVFFFIPTVINDN